jgi:lactoylglutathione lyase
MDVSRAGLILKTKDKAACVDFYRNILQLPVLFENDFLTCFSIGASYLMIEPRTEIDSVTDKSSMVLRLNVEEPAELHRQLVSKGVDSKHHVFDWGEIVVLSDPDGNQIELKDEASFARQIRTVANPY